MEKIFKQINEQFTEKLNKYKWESPSHLAIWSAQTYYYTNHITRIMAMCAAKTDLNNNKLHQFFINHLKEEMNHQLLALNDIKKLSYRIEDLPELPSTRNFYETQYYKAESHPISFYGFGLMLELLSISAGKEIYKRVKQAGLESTFLRVHVIDDQSHAPEVEKILLGISDYDRQGIAKNLLQSAFTYNNIFNECNDFVEEKNEFYFQVG